MQSHKYQNWRGAAFFDIAGNFVGMNHANFLPLKIFLERFGSGHPFRYVGMNGYWHENTWGGRDFCPIPYKEQFPDLDSLGYPIPSRSIVNRGMVLVHTYEDPFGDLYPKGVWSEFRKRVSSEISRNVVALASFKVVAIGRIFQSGALMAASGKLTVGSGMLDCRILCYSTCKISKVGIGGPLVDVDGNFIGMNFHGMNYCCKKIGTPYLCSEDLCSILEFLKTKEAMKFSFGHSIHGDEEPINEWPVPDPYWCDPSDVEEDRVNGKGELLAEGCPVRYRFRSMSVLM